MSLFKPLPVVLRGPPRRVLRQLQSELQLEYFDINHWRAMFPMLTKVVHAGEVYQHLQPFCVRSDGERVPYSFPTRYRQAVTELGAVVQEYLAATYRCMKVRDL